MNSFIIHTDSSSPTLRALQYRRMLNLKSGMKYRQRIEQKVSLAARQPTGELCDIDSIETEIFQDKTLDQVATEVKSYAAMENASNSKKKGKGKNKKVKRTGPSSEVFSEILNEASDDE